MAINKNINGFFKFCFYISCGFLFLSLFKTVEQIKFHLYTDAKTLAKTDIRLKPSAPKNIFFILLDGTDLTSSYLDNEKFPRSDIMPNFNKILKSDFYWFPNGRSNSPQTAHTLPMIFTGKFNLNEARANFKAGNDVLNYLKKDYKINGFFYKHYYSSFCTEQNVTECYPFKKKNKKIIKRGFFIILQMFSHRATWGLVKLPFVVGEKFIPEFEDFSFEEFFHRVENISEEKNFFYLHIFRRNLLDIVKFDIEFKHLVELLKKKNIYEDSLIFLTADHGLDYTQTGHIYGLDAKFTSRVFNIPFAIKPQGLGQGKKDSFQVQTIDLAPTIFSALYEDIPLKLEGFNLLKETPKIMRKHFVICNSKGELTRAEFESINKVSKCESF